MTTAETAELSMAEIGQALADAGIPEKVPQDAPYGRRADGRPKAKPGRKPAAAGRKRRSGGPPAPPRRQPSKRAPAAPDYRPGILGTLQIPAGLLAMAGARRPELAADAATVTLHGPDFAEGLNALAQENPQVAAILEKVLQMGPWSMVVSPLLAMGLQIAVNHGWLPAASTPLTLPPDQLLEQFAPTPAEQQRDDIAAEVAQWGEVKRAEQAAYGDPGH